MWLKIAKLRAGLHPSEIVVSIQADNGPDHEASFHHTSIVDGCVDVGHPVGASATGYLVDIGREASNGSHRLWVKRDDVVDHPPQESLTLGDRLRARLQAKTASEKVMLSWHQQIIDAATWQLDTNQQEYAEVLVRTGKTMTSSECEAFRETIKPTKLGDDRKFANHNPLADFLRLNKFLISIAPRDCGFLAMIADANAPDLFVEPPVVVNKPLRR